MFNFNFLNIEIKSMYWVITILILLHGVIHLFGFLKAFDILEFENISKAVPKGFGLLWLLASLTFLTSAIMLIWDSDNWWIACLLAVIISQFLIINHWADTKFATAINIVLLIPIFISYSTQGFKTMVDEEIKSMFSVQSTSKLDNFNQNRYAELPSPVIKWLENSGAMEKGNINSVYLEQEIKLKLKPEQKDWSNATAKQYFTTDPPAFNWSIDLSMYGFLNVVGRDKFENGRGEMLIKLLSIIPVANAKEDSKIDQASLQRYLAEIVWFPTAALSKYIEWEAIDETSAKATMNYKGTEGSGVFYFNDRGDFVKFVTNRYADAEDNEPKKWTVTALKTSEMNGIRIPTECEAKWKLDSGEWTWLWLKVENIEYNFDDESN